VTLLAREDVLAYLMADGEVPGAIRWAKYYGLRYTWHEETLTFTLCLEGGSEREGEREPYLLAGTFEDYRVMPPVWRFLDPRTGRDIGPAAYPSAGPFVPGSVLHSSGVICAPWNRLAYADRSGLHGDWAEPSRWQTIAPQHTSANTLPDMLARIRSEVTISPRRLAPLPPCPRAEAAA